MRSSSTSRKIQAYTVDEKGRRILVMDGESFILPNGFDVEFHLYEGKELSEKEYKELKKALKLAPYKAEALKLVSKGSYTEKEVIDKLEAKGAGYADAKPIVDELKKIGLLDDSRYAEEYIKYEKEVNLSGKNKILHKLQEKGVRKDILDSFIFPGEEEEERAKEYLATLSKKLLDLPKRKKQEKALGALLSKGYDLEIAKSILAYIPEGDKEKEASRMQREFLLAKRKYQKKYDGYELRNRITKYMMSKGYGYQDIEALYSEEEAL